MNDVFGGSDVGFARAQANSEHRIAGMERHEDPGDGGAPDATGDVAEDALAGRKSVRNPSERLRGCREDESTQSYRRKIEEQEKAITEPDVRADSIGRSVARLERQAVPVVEMESDEVAGLRIRGNRREVALAQANATGDFLDGAGHAVLRESVLAQSAVERAAARAGGETP